MILLYSLFRISFTTSTTKLTQFFLCDPSWLQVLSKHPQSQRFFFSRIDLVVANVSSQNPNNFGQQILATWTEKGSNFLGHISFLWPRLETFVTACKPHPTGSPLKFVPLITGCRIVCDLVFLACPQNPRVLRKTMDLFFCSFPVVFYVERMFLRCHVVCRIFELKSFALRFFPKELYLFMLLDKRGLIYL